MRIDLNEDASHAVQGVTALIALVVLFLAIAVTIQGYNRGNVENDAQKVAAGLVECQGLSGATYWAPPEACPVIEVKRR
jgi:hypothetical protein